MFYKLSIRKVWTVVVLVILPYFLREDVTDDEKVQNKPLVSFCICKVRVAPDKTQTLPRLEMRLWMLYGKICNI